MEKIIFSLGDKLPTSYDAAITIFSICSTPESARMSNVICHYASALINIWEKAFGSNQVMSYRAVMSNLINLLKITITKFVINIIVKATRRKLYLKK